MLLRPKSTYQSQGIHKVMERIYIYYSDVNAVYLRALYDPWNENLMSQFYFNIKV